MALELKTLNKAYGYDLVSEMLEIRMEFKKIFPWHY